MGLVTQSDYSRWREIGDNGSLTHNQYATCCNLLRLSSDNHSLYQPPVSLMAGFPLTNHIFYWVVKDNTACPPVCPRGLLPHVSNTDVAKFCLAGYTHVYM